jgi:hypothetical protein
MGFNARKTNKHHRGVQHSECTAPSILCLDNILCWVVSLTLRPVSPSDTHRTHATWIVQLVWMLSRREKSLSSTGINLRFIGCPDHNHWLYRLAPANTKYNEGLCLSSVLLSCQVDSTFHCPSWMCEYINTALCNELPRNASKCSVSTKQP